MLFTRTLTYLEPELFFYLYFIVIFIHVKILVVHSMAACVHIFSRIVISGTIELIKFILLSKLPWFSLVCFVFVCACMRLIPYLLMLIL
jgi:hypothetical protein